jgi:hypothetical protein
MTIAMSASRILAAVPATQERPLLYLNALGRHACDHPRMATAE